MNDLNNDKQVYIEEVEVWMVDMDTVIAEARKKAEAELEGEARAQRLAEIDEMEKGRNTFRERFTEFKEDTSLAWEELKGSMQDSWDELKNRFGKMREHWEA